MKSININIKSNFHRITALCLLVALFYSCRVEKNNFKIIKHGTQDSVLQQPKYGTIKDLGIDEKIDKRALLFDQFIADDFRLPKKKRDSAVIIKYFRKTAFTQLGRKEFRQWDLVVVRGVLFQVNVEKQTYSTLPGFSQQTLMELVGMIILFFSLYL
jgi:hypothetical protein